MKIGDKVRFLSEVGGGIVTGFQGKDFVLVEDADGFDIPMPIRECVVIETDDYSDESSKFHPDHRRGTFWSVGGSWRLTQEEFLKDVEWLSNLKLKASYGTQGNDGILDINGYVVYQPYLTHSCPSGCK